MPDRDDYPKVIASIVGQLVSGDRATADRDMADIASAPGEIIKRRSPSRPVKIRVWRRDHWTCRYCGERTIFYPMMSLLGAIFPEQFPYNSYWKAGQTHPAVTICSSVIDHVVPGAFGGDWLDENNLVTACARCNARKGDRTLEQLGWKLRTVEESSWEGLTSFYRQLWEIAGRPTTEAHPQWLRALSNTVPTQRHV